MPGIKVGANTSLESTTPPEKKEPECPHPGQWHWLLSSLHGHPEGLLCSVRASHEDAVVFVSLLAQQCFWSEEGEDALVFSHAKSRPVLNTRTFRSIKKTRIFINWPQSYGNTTVKTIQS
jgi:hypothetical protein